MKRIVQAVTGASGAGYARALTRLLLSAGCRVELILSAPASEIVAEELDDAGPAGWAPAEAPGALTVHDDARLHDELASGSAPTDGMVVCPASAHTVGAIAAGLGDTLITRAAGVHLKEKRPLVIVPREMPFGAILLENLLRLDRAGAVIAPACPGFYHGPESIDDLLDFVAGRVAALLGISLPSALRYRPAKDPRP